MKWKRILLRRTERCSKHEFLLEQLKINQHAQTVAWSYDMEGHAKKCGEIYCALANRTTEQLYKVSTPCMADHNFKKEELETVGELSKVCSQVVLTCM